MSFIFGSGNIHVLHAQHLPLLRKKVTVSKQNCERIPVTIFQRQHNQVADMKCRYLRIDVAVRAVPADVHLILCGFLVHWIVKVDGVGVLQAPVSP